jgi:hypothetical protein
MVVALLSGTAAAQAAGHHHHHPPAAWHNGHTCAPQGTLRTGIYRIEPDLFAGGHGPSCMKTTNGHDFCMLTNYQAFGFPQIRVGDFYASRDPGSGFPYLVRSVRNLTVNARAYGCDGATLAKVPGTWLFEVHMWFYDDSTIRGHGTAELVIVMAHHNWLPYCTNSFRLPQSPRRPAMMMPPVRIRIAHAPAQATLAYCGNRHRTGGASGWPLIVIQLLHQRRHLSLHVQPLLTRMRKLHWLSGSKWLGNVQVGAECSVGCKGLFASALVS